MSNQPFPFFAGQHTRGEAGIRCVLSPLPVKTAIPASNSCDLLLMRTAHYIDLGGVAGSIFQTQQCYMLFMMGFLSFLTLFLWQGGIEGVVDSFYPEKRIAEGHWVKEFSGWECFLGLGGLLSLLCLGIYFLVDGICGGNRQFRQVLPLRFHRQRREVMFSRWDKKAKKTEIKIVPWEQVCAMVGQGTGVSASGVFTLSSLFIGVNDEDDPGHFWSGLEIGAMHNIAGVAQWEMLRRFMDEGPDTEIDVSPSQLTFEALVAEHCQMLKIDVEQFGIWRRFWWEINGTRLGILVHNYRLKLCSQTEKAGPEFKAWSQPIPESQWAKPSAELNYYNQMLEQHEYSQGLNILAISDLRELFGPYPPQAKDGEGSGPIGGERAINE